MEKFYCEIFGQKIWPNEKQCYFKKHPLEYYKNETCLKCSVHNDVLEEFVRTKFAPVQPVKLSDYPTEITIKRLPERINKWHPPKEIKKDLIQDESFEKYPNLRRLVEDVPFILNLHPSYWENQNFLQWQLMRLNKVYQENSLNVFSLYNDVLNDDDVKNEDLIADLNMLQYDYFPDCPNEPIESWISKWEPEEKQLEFKRSAIDGRKIKFLRACKHDTDPYDQENLIGFRARGIEEKMLLPSPEFFLLTSQPPIDHTVRFPLPYFLKKLPSYKEEWKTKKGSPMYWGRNLLAYELNHQFEIDEDIIVG